MKSSDNPTVMNHIMDNENNLILGKMVAEAFPQVVKQLVINFFNVLEKDIIKILGQTSGFKVDNGFREFTMDKKYFFTIAHPDWRDIFSLQVGNDYKNAKKFWIGVKKGEGEDNIIWDSLYNMLIKSRPINSPGESSNKYIWYVYLPGKWLNWDEDKMLVSLLELYRNNEQRPAKIVSEMNGFIMATLDIIQRTIS